jgi:hypothetical protein
MLPLGASISDYVVVVARSSMAANETGVTIKNADRVTTTEIMRGMIRQSSTAIGVPT